MKFAKLCFGLLATLLLCPIEARADLASDIDAVVRDKLLDRAAVGIDVARLDDGNQIASLYQLNPTLPLVPASNLKVVTTSAALEKFGPDFRFRTLLLLHNGNLVLIGDGDPTLGDAELLKKVGWDVNTVFSAWAASLVKRQITSVHDLLVDDSVFDMQFLHPNWPADQTQKRYDAEIAGLDLNANCLDVYVRPTAVGEPVSFTTDPVTSYATIKNTCVGGPTNAVWLSRLPGTNDLILRGTAREANQTPISVTLHDPPIYAGTVLAETLRAAGVTLSGTVQRDRDLRAQYQQHPDDGTWTLLAEHDTKLASVISRANKDSMNLYAESVCKRLGFAATGQGTWAAGTEQVGRFLQSLGISPTEYHLDDGCGLSKQNAVSAHVMLSVLVHDFFGPNSETWMGSLAVAGEDGTLADRFRGTDLRGRVIAKSGYVNGVSCLSGYLHARDDRWYCFSILFNGIPEGTNSSAKILQERIVRAIDRSVHVSTASGN
ncbi:MAG: D-alanyl-D-alanine carboxypeptidase/D-alanyl-D-alanine-endopeptidase [Tepidisphaeraceae bacterium]